MIVYRVELWCDGCHRPASITIPHDSEDAIPVCVRNLEQMATEVRWIKDRGAHWCPDCQRQRKEVDHAAIQ